MNNIAVRGRQSLRLQDGELIKQKEICKWCGREFITFERIPGGSIRGRHYCCIEHSCMALAKEKEAENKVVKKKIQPIKPEITQKECPVCGMKFTAISEKVDFCDRCKYIGWEKRNRLMKERERQKKC